MTESAYPGELASPRQLLSLAGEYQRASEGLYKRRRKDQPLSLAPFRLTAIHAIELYLNAALLAQDHRPRVIRGLGHDLVKRAQIAQGLGLNLRKRTIAHLASLCANREYLVSRYAPEPGAPASHIDQLVATLEDVAKKSRQMIKAARLKQRPAPLSR